MKLQIYTPNLDLVYENGVVFIHYVYQSFISVITYINL